MVSHLFPQQRDPPKVLHALVEAGYHVLAIGGPSSVSRATSWCIPEVGAGGVKVNRRGRPTAVIAIPLRVVRLSPINIGDPRP